MKKIITTCIAIIMASTNLNAITKLDIKDVTSGKFTAEYVSGVNSINGTDYYASINNDKKKIIEYSFKTGKPVGVLFDVDDTQGEKINSFDGYIFSPNGQKMLIQTKTEKIYRRSFKATYYIYTVSSKKLEKLSDGGPQQVPVWSPNCQQIAFVRDNNIYLVKLLYDNAESQVTTDGKFNSIINGIPDWVNEEEFSFNCALVFSADSKNICWIKYDESQVDTYQLQLFKGLNPEKTQYDYYPGLYSYKYPKAGRNNSKVSVWSYDIKSHRSRQLDVPLDADGYIPRIKATDDPNSIMVVTLNRHQDNMNFYTVNPNSTIAKLVVKETATKYVRDDALSNIIMDGNLLMFLSDRTQKTALYVYNTNGTLLRTVTADNGGNVTAVYGFDSKTGDVYYQAATINPHDRQIFVSHKNGKSERITDLEGWNTAIFSGDYKYFINTWSDYNTPYVFTVRSNSGHLLTTLVDNKALKEKTQECGWVKKEPFTFTTSEGVTLDGWMVRPSDFNPSKRYPVIMFQYSGPSSQQVVNSWNAGSMGNGGAFDMYLAQQGFIVVCVDGRGTGGRGSEFEKCIYQQMGKLESKDQVETALWLGKQSYVDKDRIGIWGWSYGGFNTLMSMSEGRGVFRAGVAVAPPTNWKYYDTVYTERYMRTPQENPTGYGDNPIQRADKLHGALLICHGTADDNVNPQNTFEYAEALVQADKDFKENYYTNRNHSIYGGNTRNHLMRQIANFFISELK